MDNQQESQPQEDQKPRFEIQDESGLKWAFMKAEQKRKEVQSTLEMMEQSDEFYMDKIDKLRADIDYFKSIIAEYADKQLLANPNWEYKSSPFGRIVRSKASKKLVIADKKALTERLKGTKYVETKEVNKLNWADLKKSLVSPDDEHVMTEDGEPIKDVKVVVTPSKLEIKHKNERGNWTTKEE